MGLVVTSQISSDPNIVEKAMAGLRARYTEAAKATRNNYLQTIIDSSSDYSGNVQTKQEESITNQNSARQKYLESLNQ